MTPFLSDQREPCDQHLGNQNEPRPECSTHPAMPGPVPYSADASRARAGLRPAGDDHLAMGPGAAGCLKNLSLNA